MKTARTVAAKRIGLFLVMFTGATCVCSAATFTAKGSDSDGALSAQAVFTPGNGTLSIALTNELKAETSIGQAISDISFSISGQTGSATYAIGATSQQISLSDGTVSSPVMVSGDSGYGYKLTTTTTENMGTVVTLEGMLGRSQSNNLIVGSGPYGPKGSPSQGGFGSHTPDLLTTGNFNLNIPGVTSASTISNVTFSFGTGPDAFLPGEPVPSSVPEPTSILLLATMVALGGKLLVHRLSA